MKQPGEVDFTGGRTESDNAAVLGAARAACGKGRHVVAIERFLLGAGHESGRREGTENVAGVVGEAVRRICPGHPPASRPKGPRG